MNFLFFLATSEHGKIDRLYTMLSSTLLLVRLLAFANGIFSVTTSEVEHQTLSLGEWTPIAPIATYERQEFTTVTLNTTNIYMIGGVIPLSSTGDPFPTVTYMQTYSLPKDEWTSVAPVPVALNHPNAAVVEGKIYLLGGLTPGEPATWVASSACFVYDPVGDEWTSLGDMPDGRGSAAVGVREKTMYVLLSKLENFHRNVQLLTVSIATWRAA